MAKAAAKAAANPTSKHAGALDWERVAKTLLVSRALDDVEEKVLLPGREMFYQFSARGHDLAQVILSQYLTHPFDCITGYYRSRPILLGVGVGLDDALAGSLARTGGYSDGRDVGSVFNFPNPDGPKALPMSGGVGTQYTPGAGWAQALEYYRDVLHDPAVGDAIAVVLGGDGSVASNGFWSALTMATTLKLPLLFYIEDNGYGISVPSSFQTPGGNIAANLAAFKGLTIFSGDGTEAAEAAKLAGEAVAHVRGRKGPAMLHLKVPRLAGHSGQDTQAYKSVDFLQAERDRDPLPKFKAFMLANGMSEAAWNTLAETATADVGAAVERVRARDPLDPADLTKYVYSEPSNDNRGLQLVGGLRPLGHKFAPSSETPDPQGPRINMVTAIRRALDFELGANPKVVLFGEDIGPKGGVHAVTMGLQEKYGIGRVTDTSLSEEGIIGRAVGMALAGLMPVPEIQFRKYADPAAEQLNDAGTMRWRTGNRFAVPMVVRMAGGFSKCGDPWHSQTNEVQWVHNVGWHVAVPSNAEDAVGLLRTALRGNDPVIFFEHRGLLDLAWSRRPYPGDQYVVPFGQAKVTMEGSDITLVTWGAMVPRCEDALKASGFTGDVVDLRTLMPWDREAVMRSVRKTHRCLVVHEDNGTAGFGAEIVAFVSKECFFDLDAAPDRLTMPDIPSPYNPKLLEAAVPGVEQISRAITDLVTS